MSDLPDLESGQIFLDQSLDLKNNQIRPDLSLQKNQAQVRTKLKKLQTRLIFS